MSAPTKETGPTTGPVTHDSTTDTPTIYIRPPEPDKGFLVKAAAGKVRAGAREPDRTHYECADCRWTP